MKRQIILTIVFLLCSQFVLYAASVGDPETLGLGKFDIAFVYEYIFRRKMEFLESNIVNFGTKYAKIRDMDREMVKISYGLLDNIDVYTKLGLLHLESVALPYIYLRNTYAGNSKLKSKRIFTYGFGVKGAYPFADSWVIGTDFQYLYFKGKMSERTPLTTLQEYVSVGKTAIHDWQVSSYIGKRLGRFIMPYVGIKYSDLRGQSKEFGTENWVDTKARHNWGTLAGLDCKIGENFHLNCEGRFIDEIAMSVEASYRF